jgi:hypothetical protein
MKMKRFFSIAVVVFCMFCFLGAEGGPYELTKVDVFSLKVNLTGSDIAVNGVTIKTPLDEALAKLKKTKADIAKKGKYKFLVVEPGFKLRISGNKINALLVSDEFKAKLIGATAKLFDNLESEEKFKSYVIKYFLKPDNYEPISVAGYESNTITYVSGLNFTRFHSREGTTCVWIIQAIGF